MLIVQLKWRPAVKQPLYHIYMYYGGNIWLSAVELAHGYVICEVCDMQGLCLFIITNCVLLSMASFFI